MHCMLRVACLKLDISVLDSANKVEREGPVDLLGVGEAEVVHDLDELLLVLRQPRVEGLLLEDGGAHQALVVMSRIDDALVREREDLGMNRFVQEAWVSLLEVCSPAAADEHGVSCEAHGAVVEHVAHAAVGVARGRADLELMLAEFEHVTVDDEHVGLGAGLLGDDGLHAGDELLELPGAGDVVSMAVGVDAVDDLETEILCELGVSLGSLDDGVDEDGFLGGFIAEEVGVGAALLLEELAEDKTRNRRSHGGERREVAGGVGERLSASRGREEADAAGWADAQEGGFI
mmetsp:Transcript_17589/g.39777  ORF Transcript_17589/g.39777 Transcript_17589/m.39777 type:complete len:290 (+) Transcript_17589:1060-1929(+)